jgi:hypothetical protein
MVGFVVWIDYFAQGRGISDKDEFENQRDVEEASGVNKCWDQRTEKLFVGEKTSEAQLGYRLGCI